VSFGALIVMTFFGAFVDVAFVIWVFPFCSVNRMGGVARFGKPSVTRIKVSQHHADTFPGAREPEPERGA
jgi:hypothetical protein